MAAAECRFDVHVAVAAAIGGSAVDVEACDEPATHRVICRFDSDGVSIEIASEVCAGHEQRFIGATGYQRSIKLRSST